VLNIAIFKLTVQGLRVLLVGLSKIGGEKVFSLNFIPMFIV